MNFDEKIAIIGSGPAGISAAWFLQQQGYNNFTVFEKKSEIGGKTTSFFYNERPYDMAAVEVTPDFKFTLDFVKQFGLSLETMPPVYLIDPDNGKQYELSYLFNNQSKKELLKQAIKYIEEWLVYSKSYKESGFHDIGRDISQPFSKWLEEKGLLGLYNAFLIPVTCYAYGYLEEIPAAYILKYMNPVNFGTLLYQAGLEEINEVLKKFHIHINIEWPKRIKEGMQTLMQTIGGQLICPVKTSCEVKSVKRSIDGVTLEYTNGAGVAIKDTFDRLIVTSPQTLQNLTFMDLSEEEIEIFGQVTYSNCYTYALSMTKTDLFPYKGFADVVNNGSIVRTPKEIPSQFWRCWEDTNCYIFYLFADHNADPSKLRESLRMNVEGIGGGEIEIFNEESWCYFPHADSDSMAAGFYEKLESIQGRNRTYYSGGLLNFELVENSIAYSNDLVNRFFLLKK